MKMRFVMPALALAALALGPPDATAIGGYSKDKMGKFPAVTVTVTIDLATDTAGPRATTATQFLGAGVSAAVVESPEVLAATMAAGTDTTSSARHVPLADGAATMNFEYSGNGYGGCNDAVTAKLGMENQRAGPSAFSVESDKWKDLNIGSRAAAAIMVAKANPAVAEERFRVPRFDA
ncbi:MAG: hypothetical protein V1489_01610 [Candidatus Liptonbacteria bacterium]